MTSQPLQPRRTGAQILVDQLRIQGVDTVFCVPGESFLAVLDALVDAPGIRLITCRNEGGAAMMAEAWGKLTGRPGVVFASRGPGATNASSGLHVARQDSTPFLLFIGQNERAVMEREGFQELDYRRVFGTMAKGVFQIDDAARVSEFVTRAFSLAMNGRPGPVVIALPEDMLTDTVQATDGARVERSALPVAPVTARAIRDRLAGAETPLVMIGGGDWTAAECAALQDWAAANDLPVCASFRRQDKFDNEHPNYIGELGLGANPALLARVAAADVLLVLGARLGEIGTNGFATLGIPRDDRCLIHVYPSPDELGHVFQPTLAVPARPGDVVAALAALEPLPAGGRSAQVAAARAAYLDWTAPRANPGAVQMCQIVRWLDQTLPPDTIYTNGAGNFAIWPHRFHRYRQPGTQVAPVSGSMGYGVPAAIAAALAHPQRRVICFAGDGDFQMTGQELATAVQYGARIRVLIVNNGMLGTIRMHQERNYPARVSGTDLAPGNPDFVALARAYGAYGERVTDTERFAGAFARADAFDGPAVLDLAVDPEAITPVTTLSQLRAQAIGRTS